MKTLNNIIPDNLYKKIIDKIPIVCVDVIINKNDSFLMVWRNTEPAKQQWWLPGGRVYKFETLEQAAIRKAKEETGIDCIIKNQVLTDNTIFDTGPYKIPVHSVNVCYSLVPKNKKTKITIDKYSDSFKWCEKVDINWHSYIIKCLIMEGYTI